MNSAVGPTMVTVSSVQRYSTPTAMDYRPDPPCQTTNSLFIDLKLIFRCISLLNHRSGAEFVWCSSRNGANY